MRQQNQDCPRAAVVAAVLLFWPVLCSATSDQEKTMKDIQEEVRVVNSGLAKAIQSEPKCGQYDWCEMTTVFTDNDGRIRKIVEWVEGNRRATSKSEITTRSMWEWYYLPNGKIFFVFGRYEGQPGFGELQEHQVYIHDGRVIQSLRGESRIAAFHGVEPTPNDDIIGRAHKKLSAAETLLNLQSPADAKTH